MQAPTVPDFPARRSRARALAALGASLVAILDPAQVTLASTEPASAPQPAPLSASDAFAEFRREFDAGRYAAAEPFARQVLGFAEAQAKSPADEEVQVAVMNLAITQHLMGDYPAAEASYLRAIELVQSSGRPLHARLARAYGGLATVYHDDGRHESATTQFERAVALTRRHEGLLSDAQLPLLEKYVDSLTELGRYPDAIKNHRYVLRIVTRKYGATSAELAPTLERIGRWYTRVGLFDQARRTIRRAIELVEAADGPQSPRLVGPLTALAQCNRREILDPGPRVEPASDRERAALFHDGRGSTAPGIPGAIQVTPAALGVEGERALLRAAAIAESRPDASPVQIADVQTQLGDWYQSRGSPERALPSYQKAWAAAAGAAQPVDGRPLVEALFGQPTLLVIARPEDWDRYASRPAPQVETRNVVLEFTVLADGAPSRPVVRDDSGDARRAEKTTAALATARYRPRFENGQPVPTTGVTFTQPWIVLLPAPTGGGDTPTPESPGRGARDT